MKIDVIQNAFNLKQLSCDHACLGSNVNEESLELGEGDLAVTVLVHLGETLLETLYVEGLGLTAIGFLEVGPFFVEDGSECDALCPFEEAGVVLVKLGEVNLGDLSELFFGEGHFKICF